LSGLSGIAAAVSELLDGELSTGLIRAAQQRQCRDRASVEVEIGASPRMWPMTASVQSV
jgi:hypothetical protein